MIIKNKLRVFSFAILALAIAIVFILIKKPFDNKKELFIFLAWWGCMIPAIAYGICLTQIIIGKMNGFIFFGYSLCSLILMLCVLAAPAAMILYIFDFKIKIRQ